MEESTTDAVTDHQGGPIRLLRSRRFRPFFQTQLLGAFNDNIYKNALIGLLTFQAAQAAGGGLNSLVLINVSAGLFILPFFLFSATAGQIADKYEKSMLIRRIKVFEIVVMMLGAVAFFTRNVPFLMGVLFLMGAQSAFFGPIKYGILPQALKEEELVGGNALVELGTFLAILLGTLGGGLLIGLPEIGIRAVAGVVIALAVLGWLSSLGIPRAEAVAPELKINWNPASQTWRLLDYTRKDRTVFLSILGISWFWFYGSTFLAQVPGFGRDVLGGNQQVVTLLLATFTLGIGVGSILCERLSGRVVELGLVPIGAFGMTVFAFDLWLQSRGATAGVVPGAMDAGTFMGRPGSWRILADLTGIAVCGGLYIVPLYALVQLRTDAGHRSRVISGLNIMNALFMVVSALVAVGLLKAGLTITQLFLTVALMNVAVAVFIFTLVPEFMMRLIVWLLIHTIYRVDKSGLDNLPRDGPAVLVCNHVSYVDALLIGAISRRPVRFVMYHRIFSIPVLNFVFRTSRAIPIAPAREDPELLEAAYDRIDAELADGNMVCIFPEGRLTGNGEMNPFKGGVDRIIARRPVPVVPIALQGLWGSIFSRDAGRAMMGLPRRLWSRVAVVVGAPIPAAEATSDRLFDLVAALRGDAR